MDAKKLGRSEELHNTEEDISGIAEYKLCEGKAGFQLSAERQDTASKVKKLRHYREPGESQD